MKKFLALVMTLLVMGLMSGSLVSAVSVSPTYVEVPEVKVNGNHVDPDDVSLSFEEGETLEIKAKLVNSDVEDADDVKVSVEVKGYDSDLDVEDSVTVDVDAGESKWVNLELTLPAKLSLELDDGTFLLKLEVSQSGREDLVKYYKFNLDQPDYALGIKDVDFNPGTTVTAGQALFTKVLLKNYGEDEAEDVKVTVEVPELGLKVSDYMDDLDSGEKAYTDEEEDELYLKLPACTPAGDYTLKVTAKHDEGVATESYTLTVLASDKCPVGDVSDKTTGGKLILTLGPETQNVAAGKQAVYPVALTNAGETARTYVLELTTGEWADSKLSEGLVVLESGQSKVVYAYLTPGKDATGQNVATLAIKADDSVLKTIYLKANVTEQQESAISLRSGLEIALVVLVVVLVIVGLVLGFSRLRKDQDDEDLVDEEGKNYY